MTFEAMNKTFRRYFQEAATMELQEEQFVVLTLAATIDSVNIPKERFSALLNDALKTSLRFSDD
jgi:hypothetical protein